MRRWETDRDIRSMTATNTRRGTEPHVIQGALEHGQAIQVRQEESWQATER